MALTLDHLATLPKRDKDYSISSFVQEQQRFSKQYLYEGQRVVQSWNYSEPISPPSASPKNDPLLGFGTPVLRARLDLVSTRVSRPNGTGHNKTTRGQESSKENERPSGHGAKLPDTDKQKEGSQKKYFSKAGKKRSKEYHLRSNSDNESVQRRADRRQRKKTKRDIMDPESSGDSDNEAKPSDTCKNRKQTKCQSKLRQEFALMHGFSSTNVGKNRLTLNPGLRDIGVFQKGKASRKTDVIQSGKRKRQDSGFLFSEATFLNKSRQKASKIDFQKVAKISTTREQDSAIASSASMRSTQAQTDSDMVEIKSRKSKGNKTPSQSNLVSKTKPQNEDNAQTGYNPADSIVWDIEEAEPLGSEVSSSRKQGSIVLKIDYLPSTSNEVPGNEVLDTNTTALEGHLKSSQQKALSVTQSDAHSSPSLGPFQSASQIGLKTVDVVSLPTVPSKYFKPLPQKLAEPHCTINQLDTKPPTLSELEKLSTAEDTIPQVPEPASHLHHSTGLSVRSYCEGRPNFIPSMESNYDLEVSLYCEGYPDSEFWSPVDHPGELGTERLDDMDNVVDHVSDGQTNSHVVISADDEIWTLDYAAGGELGEKDHAFFIPLSGYQSMELPNSIAPSLWLSDAYSDVSERTREIAYQDSEGANLLSIDPGSEDQQMQSDGGLNLEHGVLSTDLELYPDVVHHFWQGRSLLYGLNTPGDSSSLHKLSNVEADVARQLQLNHWQPQKL